MSEKAYWIVAAVFTAGLIAVGIRLYLPVLTGLHALACVLLILIVLLQSGRAADLAGAFGGAGSQTAFGPRGQASILSQATTFLAIVFMVTSMALAIFVSGPGSSAVAGEEPAPAPAPPAEDSPVTPSAPPEK